MPDITQGRRDVQRRFRAVDCPKLFAWPTGNGGTALPEILSESTYTGLATLKSNADPIQGGAASNEIYFYRPGADEKMIALEFMSVAGGNNETVAWELGLYAFPKVLTTNAGGYATATGWKMFGRVTFTMTLGQLTIASQTTDPYVNLQTFASSALRYADTYTETLTDFNNTTAGFYQVFPLGYGANDKSGHLIVDQSFSSLMAIRLVAKATSSTQELVGLYTEIN